ncbi:MAG TPA: DUF3021 domain-containing protein [Candidatus Aphodomonas merdavium]|nr:DUF3021 domain-containing protein [Candidatus Aphodomonas merdavium]
MKKKVILRSLLGAPLALALATLITIAISFTAGDGTFYPVAPAFLESFPSEISAVAVQAAASMLYGALWGGASVIWEMERWNLLRQTLTHLAVICATTLPIAYFLRWMPHTFGGVLGYFGAFFGIYLCIWLSLYLPSKWQIAAIQRKISEDNGAASLRGRR